MKKKIIWSVLLAVVLAAVIGTYLYRHRYESTS